MSLYRIGRDPEQATASSIEVFADDELDALGQVNDLRLIEDGDDGSIERIEPEPVEDYEPEGPG